MSTKLENHLYPKGRSQLEPDLMPNVLDSDGEVVTFNGPKRITTEATVVNLGDSPNSNNGDPLRTAFAKVNNFIEASYWVNDSINQKLSEMDSELREGIFIYGDMDSDFDSDIIKAIADANGDPDSDYHPIRIAEMKKRRYQYSLLDNSSLHFRGKRNQIEVNVTKQKGSNNPWMFDSEIHINVGLASTVELNTLNVNEFFSIVDSEGVRRVTYRTSDYPIDHDERPLNGVDAEFNIGTNVVLGRDSDDVVVFKARVASNILPYGDEIYNLGDSDNKWKDLYLGGNTIYLGSIQIKNHNNRGLILIDSDGRSLDLTIESGVASTLRVDSDFQADGDTTLLGDLYVKENARFDSDVYIKGILQVDSDFIVNGKILATGAQQTDGNQLIKGELDVESSATILQNLNVGQDTTMSGGLAVSGNARFDSDVLIAGGLTVQGTTTYINTQNLEVADSLIVLNKNQNAPTTLDTGIIYQRYDSDGVSSINNNIASYWSEPDSKYHIGETDTTGHGGNTVNLTMPYMSVGPEGVEFYDNLGNPLMIWSSQDGTLRFGDSDSFTIDANQGLLEGNDITIDGGNY